MPSDCGFPLILQPEPASPYARYPGQMARARQSVPVFHSDVQVELPQACDGSTGNARSQSPKDGIGIR